MTVEAVKTNRVTYDSSIVHAAKNGKHLKEVNSTKGTGLGLAIVSGIVKANRGRVFAENHPAGGAVFHVALPLNMRDSPHP